MSWFGPPSLDDVPSIWIDDAQKLAQCKVETVDDLVHRVRTDGLSALSEETDIPGDQLRSYLEVAERESSQARTRRGGGVALGLAAVLAVVASAWTWPESETVGDRKYGALYGLYTGRDNTLGELTDSIEPIIKAFLAYDSAASASDSARALAELDFLICGATERSVWSPIPPFYHGDRACQVVDASTKELTPEFASLLNLGAAVMHEAAGRQRDTLAYERLFDITTKLYERLGQTPSYRESAPVNLARTREERVQAYFGMRSTLDSAALDPLRKSIEAEIKKLETRVMLAHDALQAAVTGSVEALAGDQAQINSTIAPIPASIRDVESRLETQLGLLEELKGMVSRKPDTVEVTPTGDCPGYVLQDESTVVRDLRRHLRTLDADVELVTLELQVDEEGRVPEGGATLIGSQKNERLGKAVEEAAQNFVFQLSDSTCDRVRYEILFKR